MTSTFHPHQPSGNGTVLPWLVGIPAAVLTALALTWTWCSGAHDTLTPPTTVNAWQVRFVNAPPDSQAAGFAGSYCPGELLFAPPGALFTCTPRPAGASGTWRALDPAWTSKGGRLDEKGHLYTPQHPGLFRLAWHPAQPDGQNRLLHVLVLHEAERDTSGNRTTLRVLKQNIGTYGNPSESRVEKIAQHASRYQPPRYFAVLDRQTMSLKVGRNLELGQLVAFIDRRGTDGRKIYTQTRHTNVLPPSKALCDKISLLMERLQSEGVTVSRFWITSGFRTPAYNRSIGGATHSRHCYGDAVDLLIDENGDRHMDDLNGDGRSDHRDGLVIAKVCLALERDGLVEVGGIGVYGWSAEDSVRSHVHIDCRGYPARWGQISRGRKRLSYDWWSKLESKR